jgi:putative NADH-flavin reductase
MRLALLGGSGRTGGHLLAWAQESGHEVTALARNPESLRASAGLTIVAGDATDPDAVAAVVDGADAVLSALGPRGIRAPAILAPAAHATVQAMRKAGATRLIVLSASGAFISSDPDMPAVLKLIVPRVLARTFADVRAMEDIVSGSGLRWTLVRATRLVDTPLTGRYRVRPDYPPPGGRKISRADVAHFIAVALDQDSWVGGAPALAY